VLLCILLAACAGEEPTDWLARELGADAEFQDIFFLDSRHGWIVGGSHNIEGGIIGSTDDGGLSWRFRSGLVRTTASQHLFRFNAVWFTDERNGVIVGSGGAILRTVDGGEHWHTVRWGPRVSSHLFDVYFVDSLHGWAVGLGGVLRTVDGGERWAPALRANAESVRVTGFAIHFLDLQHGIVVGSAGQIRRTTDGGYTWTHVNDPPGKNWGQYTYFGQRLG